IQAKNAYPSVPIVAIINPSSGPSSSIDSNYVSGIQQLQAAGVKVLGYVYTSYGTRSTSSIESDINSYNNWYHVNGIFFDEMANKVGFETYYSNLSSYAKSLSMTMTVGNPGTDTLSSYIGTVDILDIYENPSLPALTSLTGWHTSYPKSNFGFIGFGVSSLPNQSIITADSSYVAYMYITDDTLPNPYDTVPSYLNAEVGMLNTGSTSTTAPGAPTGLTATAASSSQINLSWIAPANNGGSAITGYKIERSADNSITWSTPVANTASTTYSDAGLVASTAYTYRVSAINLVGTSSPSTTTSATTPGNTSAGTSTLTVATQDSAGNTLTSLYIALYQGGTTVTTGYSPTTFTLNNNVQYSVQAYGYNTHVFDHWKDNGSTTNPRPMTINANTQLTAVYRTPTISLNPSTAPASTIVTVTGTNFASSSTVTISYDSTAVSTSPTTITTDSSGAFTATFTVPSSSTTGIHAVTAKDASSHPASSQFTVR
ncbi:MAG: hypothetical protein E6L00_05215, partial [Thaumarchaeota archaeon]